MAMPQNNQQKTQVTTRGYNTSNSNAKKPTAMSWEFSDEMLKIVISDELPESEQTEKRRYDYEHSWITCIPRLKCLDLYNHVSELILPRLNGKDDSKTDEFVSIPLATVNQFGVGIKYCEGGNKHYCYAKLIRNIDSDSLKSSEEAVYEFRKGEVVTNYDNTTGNFEQHIIDDTEFLLFLRDLNSFVNASSKAYNHINRLVDKTYKDMVLSDIRSIGNKIGAEVSVPYTAQRNGARYGSTSLFDNSVENAPSGVITSLEDLELPFK